MNAGRIEQTGPPSEIYDAPATPFVADFIGVMNFLPVVVVDEEHVRCGEHRFECATEPHATGVALTVIVSEWISAKIRYAII